MADVFLRLDYSRIFPTTRFAKGDLCSHPSERESSALLVHMCHVEMGFFELREGAHCLANVHPGANTTFSFLRSLSSPIAEYMTFAKGV